MTLSPKLFTFLRELKKHNDREWFAANRERYEEQVRGPLLGLVTELGPKLARVSKHIVADPRPVGGSLFRIHRDVRFSKDKSPYKTHAALHLRHAATTRDVHGPGFYVHLEPGQVFVAGGMWMPAPESLAAVRDAMVEAPATWKRATKGLELGGAQLKRTPRGYAADPVLESDLRRTDYIVSVSLDERRACAPGFADQIVAACRKTAPLMAFLAQAVGLPW